jgi:Ca2+-binding RTX toxin-like protein
MNTTKTKSVITSLHSNEIVFVDTSVQDWQNLVTGVRPDVQVIQVEPRRDGVAQIAEALAGQHDIDALHIISHGAAGTLILGATVLNGVNLSDHAALLSQIGQSLTASGDILLYGCNVAAGENGQSFIDALAAVTGVDVAASADPTGSAALGGDWTLEASVGPVEASMAVSVEVRQGYASLLDYNLIVGAQGSDFIVGTPGDDIVYTLEGDDEIWALAGNDFVYAGSGNDIAYGYEGDDFIDGGEGADIMFGNQGNDTYVVDNIGDMVIEDSDEGFDEVLSSIDYILPYNVKNLTLTGSADLSGTGNVLDNILTGNQGNDTLIGVNTGSASPGAGEIDQFSGGAGSDRFVLGDTNWVGYDDFNAATDGAGDYAVIVDFSPAEDSIQLQGSNYYRLETAGADTRLYIDNPGAKPDELIAVMQNVTGLDLSSPAFVFAASPNQLPVALDDSYTVNEDTTLTVPLVSGVLINDHDPDANPLTASVVTAPANGTLNFNPDGSFTYDPNANFNGSDVFSYEVRDGAGGRATATASIMVNPVNDAPETAAALASGVEDVASIAVALSGMDSDGTVASFKIASLPLNGTLYSDAGLATAITAVDTLVTANSNTATVYFKPAANWNGATSFDYVSVDNGGLADATPATASITVTAVNDAVGPVTDANAAANTVAENVAIGTVVGITALATDADGDAVSYSLTNNAGGKFAIDATTGVVTVAGALDYETAPNPNITVLATSADNSTSTQIFSIAVSNVVSGQAPTDIDWNGIPPIDNELPEHKDAIASLSTVDSDSSSFTYALLNGSSSGFSLAGGNILRSPDMSNYKTYTLVLKSTDSTSLSFTEMFTIKTGANGDNTLMGTSGDDIFYGLRGDDFISGLSGNDTLFGQGGDDTLKGGAGNDKLDGGSGVDLLDLSDASAGVNFTLTQSGSNTVVDLSVVGLGVDTYRNMEGVIGSAYGGTLIGCNSADVLVGGDGLDKLMGGRGDDVLKGKGGNDIFDYKVGDGADFMDGGTGSDSLAIVGTSSNDTLNALVSHGEISGVAGGMVNNIEQITLALGAGNDTLSYAGTVAGVAVNLATSSATGFISIGDVENVIGGNGNDALTGDASANVINGGAGGDTITGDAGADKIDVGNANDNVQDHVVYNAANEGGAGEMISDFDSTGYASQVDTIDIAGLLKAALDNNHNGNLNFGLSANSNNSNTAVNLNTVEALYLGGSGNDGVSTANLTNASAIAAEFNAEFNITVSEGEQTLLVINDNNYGSHQAAFWLYTESVSPEIQASELTLIGVVQSNADLLASQFHFV